MFVDASAIVAVLKSEPESAGFLTALEATKGKVLTSPIARFEAVISLASQMARSAGATAMTAEHHKTAEGLVADLLAEVGASEIHITESIGKGARDAALAYGKLAGHVAQLNMGDCFAYACAKAAHAQLLYKGDDFKHTDLG